MSAELSWLPRAERWAEELAALPSLPDGLQAWETLVRLAGSRIDFVETGQLDRVAQRMARAGKLAPPKPIRIGLLGSSTTRHLLPGLRLAGLRRGLWFEVYEGGYGQYLQELFDDDSELAEFQPEFCCFALDARHLLELTEDGVPGALERLEAVWRKAQERFGATVIQQAALPVFADLLGNNESRLPDSPSSRLAELNVNMRERADASGVAVLAVDRYCAWGGIDMWHDSALWHLAKQEVHPAVSPLYGDLLARLVAAQRGRSAKCLVLDLDHTVWGGGVGDDGIDGIRLSRGDAVGEAHLEFQRYCLELKRRGVVLAVCSKNDEANALEPFRRRPEMLLKEHDIACFMANWTDKATNLRAIAARLNLGLDALVFADDNPMERGLVRRELPEVMVPEMPDDPAGFVQTIARAGYFEALNLTEDDRRRAEQYRANAQREQMRAGATDLEGYLRSLAMELAWRPFDEAGLDRIVQLMNKTNQFNLTTARRSEAEVRALMQDACCLTWQFRLKDRFGDNGVVALVDGRLGAAGEFTIDQWLMSCRVLGRGVEAACLNVVAAVAAARGANRLVGLYRPTAKNGMVRDLYPRLGFGNESDAPEESRWTLPLDGFEPRPTVISVVAR